MTVKCCNINCRDGAVRFAMGVVTSRLVMATFNVVAYGLRVVGLGAGSLH